MRDAVAMYWGHTQKLPIHFKKGILASQKLLIQHSAREQMKMLVHNSNEE